MVLPIGMILIPFVALLKGSIGNVTKKNYTYLSWLAIILIALPEILGFAISQLCPYDVDKKELDLVPPPWVFQYVWPMLYGMIGIAWFLGHQNFVSNVFYIVLNVLLCLWVYLYSCSDQKKYSAYLFLLIFLTIFLYFVYCAAKKLWVQMALLMPLLVWLVFAFVLNVSEVNELDNTNKF